MYFKKQIPNIITTTRLISAIIGFLLFIKNKFMLAIILYIYGGISDFFDGYFARKFDAYSKFGKYLDSITDKIYLLSIIILSIIYSNYLIVLPLILEIIISIINIITLRLRNNVYTELVGKIKMAIEIIMLLISLLAIKYSILNYLFIILLLLTIYFQIQSIFAYINQMNNRSNEMIINYKNKKIKEIIRLLVDEFIYYLIHPVKIIK